MLRDTPSVSSGTAGTQGISQGMEGEQHPVSCSPSMKPGPSRAITHRAPGGPCRRLRWMRPWIALSASCRCSGSTWNAGKNAGNLLDGDNGVAWRWGEKRLQQEDGKRDMEQRETWRRTEWRDLGKAGERHTRHEDNREGSEIPQGIVWQFHVWQGKVSAGPEDAGNAPGTSWNRVYVVDLTPTRDLPGGFRCLGNNRLQAVTIP